MYLGKMISIRTKQHLSNIWGSIHYKCCLYKKYMRMNFRHIVFKLTPIKSVCESVSIELILHEPGTYLETKNSQIYFWLQVDIICFVLEPILFKTEQRQKYHQKRWILSSIAIYFLLRYTIVKCNLIWIIAKHLAKCCIFSRDCAL